MKKSFNTLLTAAFMMLVSCSQPASVTNCIDENKINKEMMCTMEYNPVCGCDNNTYGNECEARKSGVQKWTMGECPD